MPRIQPLDSATATGAAAGQSPATLAAMNGFFAALGKAPLGGKVGEQIAIAVAQSNGCEYCPQRTPRSAACTA